MVVHHDVVRGRADGHLTPEARQLNEIGIENRYIELQNLNVVILPPVNALALQAIGIGMVYRGRGAAVIDVSEPDLALCLAVALAVLELGLSLRRGGGGRGRFLGGVAAE